MRLLLYSDVHWTTNSSIVRQRGEKFSKRLENLIASVNWAEHLAEERGCGAIICLGDFFDKTELQAEELTALKEVKWSVLPHYFLIGNHEAEGRDLRYSSVYSLPKNFTFIDKPTIKTLGKDILMLPYGVKDEDIVSASIILSHNDLKGVRYGKIISQSGLDTDLIDNSCDLCINGHIHNRGDITKKISIIGNLTGQNFSEDAFEYKHGAIVLDTKTLSCEFYENPFAFNFYKGSFTTEEEIEEFKKKIKSNAVIAATISSNIYECAKKEFGGLIYKLIIKDEGEASEDVLIAEIDHLTKFKECVLAKMEINDIVLDELNKICEVV